MSTTSTPAVPPEAWKPLLRAARLATRPLERFLRIEASSVGLVVGEPLGVLLACGLSVRVGLATLPRGLATRHLVVLGAVAGVGFTMSLFIASLAFTDVHLLGAAKVGVLLASAVASVVALVLGKVLLKAQLHGAAAQTADEAESSTAT